MKAKVDSRKLSAPDRKALLAAIRAAVKAQDGKPLSFKKFLGASRLGAYAVLCHFRTWNLALKAAGFTFKRHNDPVESVQILEDWGCVTRQLGRLPSAFEYQVHGKHGHTTISKRFGAWSRVPGAFRDFAKKSANGTRKWRDVLALLPDSPGVATQSATKPARLTGRPVCGPPLEFACLRCAPANEAGVLLLFGAMARDLGFLIDSLQAEFPDCEAKRLIAHDTWQAVRIEFEYQSRNFRDHGHDPASCDLIVCWEHNWADAPENLEIIALKDEIQRFSR